MNDDSVIDVLGAAAAAVRATLDVLDDWGLAGTRSGQYRSDLAADEAALEILLEAGFGVVSEESGVHHPDRALQVVLDPVDGSTNASRRLPWYATSLAVLDADGLRAALVVNQATGERFHALRGSGAHCDGSRIVPSGCLSIGQAIVGVSGWPPRHMGWAQFRALGAAALDMCAVAAGRLDAYLDWGPHGHAPWDYLGALLVCLEAGAVVVDAEGRDLVTADHAARRAPIAAATPALLAEALAGRRGAG
ncbi:MAG: inositol monophosphatase family protein [Acidimicrobiales bacterium]